MLFLIHAGRREVRRRRGYVPMLCPVCHGLRAGLLVEITSHIHVYLIPVSKSRLEGIEVTCCDCGLLVQHGTEPPVAKPVAGRRPPSLTELVRLSWPGMYNDSEFVGALRRQEELMQGRPMEGHDRLNLMLATIEAVSSWSAAVRDKVELDLRSGLSLVIGLLVALGLGILLLPLLPSSMPYYGAVKTAVVIGLVTLGFGPFFAALRTQDQRWVRRKFLPALARGLRPFRTTGEELSAVINCLVQYTSSPLLSYVMTPDGFQEMLAMVEGRMRQNLRVDRGGAGAGGPDLDGREEILIDGKPLRRQQG